ncbi:MAG TPA: hypothetical protein VM452_04390, partial [Caulifigura sp.]|nr:hypothetical protein [Caulifigura sp.]
MRLCPLYSLVFTLAAAGTCGGELRFVDLSRHINHSLTDNLGRGFEGNSLSELPKGKQKLGDATFQIEGVVQLGSKVLINEPEKIEGIKVGVKGEKVHFLHATGYGGGVCDNPTHQWYVPKGTHIGEYIVTYDDGATEGIPIVYGEDVRDWFFHEGEAGVERGKIAWVGDNPFSNRNSCRIRLYSLEWKNPYPMKSIK